MKYFKWVGSNQLHYLQYLAYDDNYSIGLFYDGTKTTDRETLSGWINHNLTEIVFDNGRWIEVTDPKEIAQMKMKLL